MKKSFPRWILFVIIALIAWYMWSGRSESYTSTPPPGYVYIGKKADMPNFISDFINKKKVMVNGKNMWPHYKYMAIDTTYSTGNMTEIFVGRSMPPGTTPPPPTEDVLKFRVWKEKFIIFDITQYGSCVPDRKADTTGVILPFRKLPNGTCRPTCDIGYVLTPEKNACIRK